MSQSTVEINGTTYNIDSDDLVIVIGKDVRINATIVGQIDPKINTEIKVTGDVLSIDTNRNITVTGNVQGMADASGNIHVGGSVFGGADASGNITIAGSVTGDVDAGGNITCGKISGDVDAGGNVRTTG